MLLNIEINFASDYDVINNETIDFVIFDEKKNVTFLKHYVKYLNYRFFEKIF